MHWLNYHHLHYFWTIAREGSVARAGRVLGLAQPTLSAQLRTLERAFGQALFERRGRKLLLTEFGRTVFGYADEIFTLGQELLDTARGRPAGAALQVTIGVADVLPKLVVQRLVEPALRLPEAVRVAVREGPAGELLGALAQHELDVVLADSPAGPESGFRVYDHLLGECAVSVLGAARLASRYRPGFPGSLAGAPLLLPSRGTRLRRMFERWCDVQDVRPRVAGEFDDTALIKAFAERGLGLMLAPRVIEVAVARRYGLRRVGRIEALRMQFYAVSVERRVQHPAVLAITSAAQTELFA